MLDSEMQAIAQAVVQGSPQLAAHLLYLGDEIANEDAIQRIHLLARFADAIRGGGD
ncbi:hypothetical protein [Janthinobacterium sp. B9-8]|uniref:hypothetical protein n=1 Tax=Janthinobacterium sp. B9-8 TaxID=1236179 RepID=UPI000ABA0990|nr:hypothetical protein [Janthinobacterium sp. B9-8]